MIDILFHVCMCIMLVCIIKFAIAVLSSAWKFDGIPDEVWKEYENEEDSL